MYALINHKIINLLFLFLLFFFRPVLEDLASEESVLAALSPEALQASLNISAVREKHLISKIWKNSIILPSSD